MPTAHHDTMEPPIKVEGLHAMLAALPYLEIGLFYSLGLHARLLLGHWPEFGDSPKSAILFPLHGSAAMIGLILVMVAPALWMVMIPTADKYMSLRSYLTKLIIFLVGFAAALLLAKTDPGGLLNWFFD